MKKIDLIIFALESAINNIPGDDTEDYCIEALTTARELRDAEPYLWVNKGGTVARGWIRNKAPEDPENWVAVFTLGDADE